MKKIAIITNRAGGGHISLTKGMIDAITTHIKDRIEVQAFDPTPDVFPSAYALLTSWKLQFLWATLYKWCDNMFVAKLIQRLNYRLFGSTLKKFIREFQPDLIISNSPFATYELLLAKKELKAQFKTAIHVADPYSAHTFWFTNPETDLFLSPTPEVSQKARALGFHEDVIKTVGWLTRKEFLSDTHDTSLKKLLGFNEDDVLLFLGGAGFGDNKIIDICTECVKAGLQKKMKFIVNTGLNTFSVGPIVSLAQKNRDAFVVLPYLSNLQHVLTISDLIIGKAGPNFVFECIQLKKPLLAIGCIPGQEEGNLTFIQKSGIGWVEEDPRKISALILEILNDKTAYAKKVQLIEDIRKEHQDTPKRIADEIKRVLGLG